MKVGILALLQESNTFAPGTTVLENFAEDLLLTGEAIREQFETAHHEIGGFFAGMAEAGIRAIPIFAARAVPWGPIEGYAFRELLAQLQRALAAAGPLDGVLVAAHGATVSEEVRDVDGHWLSAVRKQLGPKVPLIGTLDPHANLSPQMVAACDALVAYRTNPHLDQCTRGFEAAELMVRVLRGEVQPRMAACFPPLAISIECQNTSESPCREWMELLTETLMQPHILTASAILGFPYADVEEMGAATLVVANNDISLAQREANRLARWLWQNRTEFDRKPVPVAEAVARAASADGPVCLLDIGDNVGGGGPGDATYLSQSLDEAGVAPSLSCLHDPIAVLHAEQVGVGNSFYGEIGGRSCPLAGSPLRGEFRVRAFVTGKFSEVRPTHGGWVNFDQGRTAVLESRTGLTVIANTLRTPPFSLAQITSCGLQPKHFRAIVAKGVHAPVAAYRAACREFIRVDTPGVTTANMTRMSYQRRRVPLYPFEREYSWDQIAL